MRVCVCAVPTGPTSEVRECSENGNARVPGIAVTGYEYKGSGYAGPGNFTAHRVKLEPSPEISVLIIANGMHNTDPAERVTWIPRKCADTKFKGHETWQNSSPTGQSANVQIPVR